MSYLCIALFGFVASLFAWPIIAVDRFGRRVTYFYAWTFCFVLAGNYLARLTHFNVYATEWSGVGYFFSFLFGGAIAVKIMCRRIPRSGASNETHQF